MKTLSSLSPSIIDNKTKMHETESKYRNVTGHIELSTPL